jgi:hypothetical protein
MNASLPSYCALGLGSDCTPSAIIDACSSSWLSRLTFGASEY